MTAELATALKEAASRAAAGDIAGAIASYRRALEREPERVELWMNLGVLETARGAHDGALVAFDEAARLRPSLAEPTYARGRTLFALGRHAAAQSAFERAIAMAPGHLEAHVNLALALHRQSRFAASVAPLQRARTLAPANEDIWWLLRGTLLLLRREEDALADWVAFAPDAKPSSRCLVAELASVRRLADGQREDAALERVLAHRFVAGESGLVAEVLALVQYFDVPLPQLSGLYRIYDELVREELDARGEATLLAPTAARHFSGGDKRVRIGYLSADFRAHVMGELLGPAIAAHDRARFQVTLFSLAASAHADARTGALREATDAFVELAGVDDSAAAKAIAACDVDILIDLMGHSAFARPVILARKPARVIATHLGYHGALGLSAVDYKITDAVADRPQNAAFQVEALLPLDTCLLPGKLAATPAATYSRAALGIASDAVVCATFVGVQKLSPRCVRLWRAILQQAPHAVLLFSPQREDDRRAIERRLTGLGIDASRIRFVPYDAGRLLDRYALADCALDTLPYTGGDTTLSALAAGVPVVTLCGERHAERVGASILEHAGLAELLCADEAGYVARAAAIINDPGERERIRAKVRASVADPAWADPARYARALENAYLRALDAHHLLPID